MRKAGSATGNRTRVFRLRTVRSNTQYVDSVGLFPSGETEKRQEIRAIFPISFPRSGRIRGRRWGDRGSTFRARPPCRPWGQSRVNSREIQRRGVPRVSRPIGDADSAQRHSFSYLDHQARSVATSRLASRYTFHPLGRRLPSYFVGLFGDWARIPMVPIWPTRAVQRCGAAS
jgi:hypothetical protein